MFKQCKLTMGWKLFICTLILSICTINSGGFLASNRLALAKPSKQPQKSPTTQPAAPMRNASLFDKIMGLLKPKSKSLGSRGDGVVCANSPVFKSKYPYLWTRQPVLVWTGEPSALQLIDVQSQKVVWGKSFDSNIGTHQFKIDQPLALGKRYIWRVVAEPGNDEVNPEIAFQMVSATKWKQIDQELKVLEQKSKRQKLNSEGIALEKIQYFAQYQMWGDIQEIMNNLPASLTQKQQFIDLKTAIKEELGLCLHNSIDISPIK
jgi:hypothetical protein